MAPSRYPARSLLPTGPTVPSQELLQYRTQACSSIATSPLVLTKTRALSSSVVFQTQYLRWLVMPQFLLGCRPFCLVCCRIMRSKEGLVLSSCDPVDSSSSLSLQRSSLVIETASNHYSLSTQHPRPRSPAFVRSLLPAQRVQRLRFPFFIECFGLSHTLSPPRASTACAAPMRG